MFHFPRLAVFLLAAAPTFAGLNSAVIVLPIENGRPAPAVTIVQPADYVCAIVTLRATAKDPARQSTAMRETLQRVRTGIERSPRFQLHEGAIRFSDAGSSKFYSSRSGGGPASLQTSLRVLAPLAGNPDVFEAMKQLRQFIGGLSVADDTELTVVSLSLAVAAPEQFRERLLALIADQSRAVQRSLGARSMIIDGLQNAVVVRQLDDANVELYIDYQISASVEAR